MLKASKLPNTAINSEQQGFEADSAMSGDGGTCKVPKNILEMVMCPVCFEYCRARPIYGCSNGHIICSSCKKGVKDRCPTCRVPALTVNRSAERLAENVLKDVIAFCRFSVHGCSIRLGIKSLASHEEICNFREVCCPASHVTACPWIGSLAKLGVHIRKEACVHLLWNKDGTESFRSRVIDFRDPELSVFNRTRNTYWKTVMLVSRKTFGAYMTIHRTGRGLWILQVRSFDPDSIINNITVTIQVFKSYTGNSNGDQKTFPGSLLVFTYEGGIISSNLTNEEALDTGKYLLLSDSQIKCIRTPENVFAYNVSVNVNKDSVNN